MRSARFYWSRALVVFGFSVSAWSCADTGRYVWAHDLPQQPQGAAAYVIRSGDLLDIRVYNEERLTGRPRVRHDGIITIPLVGEVIARGKTPGQLAQELTQVLSKYLNTPTVTVGVEEVRPLTITMIGEFGRAGVYTLPVGSNLPEAIATAGGFNDYADRDAIFVVRSNPPQRIRFRYRDLLQNDPATVNFKLLDGDMVTVE
ncbi:MAG: polysaccharide biosynthesis/export family protein [Myxococcota bacterium]